jgi:hypothetical protein
MPRWAERLWFVAGLSGVTAYGTFCMLFAALFAITLVLFSAKTIVYALSVIMRRVAEYKKGPVLAISALVGGIAAIVKGMQ